MHTTLIISSKRLWARSFIYSPSIACSPFAAIETYRVKLLRQVSFASNMTLNCKQVIDVASSSGIVCLAQGA